MQFVTLSGSPDQLAALGDRAGVWAPKAYRDTKNSWRLAAYVEDETLAALEKEGVPIAVIADSATLAARWAHVRTAPGAKATEPPASATDNVPAALFLPAFIDVSNRLDAFAADALVSDAALAYRLGVPRVTGREYVVAAVNAYIGAVQWAIERPDLGKIRVAVEKLSAVIDSIDSAG